MNALLTQATIKALDWGETQDVRKCRLLQSGECSDWADLLSNHGYVLFSNVVKLNIRTGVNHE